MIHFFPNSDLKLFSIFSSVQVFLSSQKNENLSEEFNQKSNPICQFIPQWLLACKENNPLENSTADEIIVGNFVEGAKNVKVKK
jgi:hypothetical protein